MKQKFKNVVKYLNGNRVFILSAIIYWIIIIFSTIFFILIGFKADSYLTFYIYEAFAICITIGGILMYRYFIGVINFKDEILLTLNLVTLSIILLSIPVAFIIMAIGAQLIEKLPDFRTFGDEGDWINFIGTIIAGTITMLGISFTIRYEKKSRENDLIRKDEENIKNEAKRIEQLEYRNPPILKLFLRDIDKVDDKSVFIKRVHINSFTKHHFKLGLNFELENVSSASIANISLLDLEVFIYEPFKHGLLEENYLTKLENAIDINQVFNQIKEYELLPTKTSIYIDLNYNLSKDFIALIDEFPSRFINTKLRIKYSSTLLKSDYIVDSTFSFSIMSIDSDYYSIRLDEPKNIYKLPKFNI